MLKKSATALVNYQMHSNTIDKHFNNLKIILQWQMQRHRLAIRYSFADHFNFRINSNIIKKWYAKMLITLILVNTIVLHLVTNVTHIHLGSQILAYPMYVKRHIKVLLLQ